MNDFRDTCTRNQKVTNNFFKNKNINKLPRESMLYRLHYYEQVFNKLNKYNVNESPLSNVYINNKRQC